MVGYGSQGGLRRTEKKLCQECYLRKRICNNNFLAQIHNQREDSLEAHRNVTIEGVQLIGDLLGQWLKSTIHRSAI